MAVIDNVYNYFLTTYGKASPSSRYDSHKKSELRDTYNQIVKINRDSPLYRIAPDEDLEKFAIDLKEQARKTQNVVSSLSVNGEGMEGVFHKKIAASSNDDALDVTYVGGDEGDGKGKGFQLGIKKLASPQVTTGNFLRSTGHDFEAGSFSFDLDTPNNSYEFQLELDGSETNGDVQQKIARLVNRSDLGITAEVLSNGRGESALKLTSRQTGLADGEDYLFKIQSGSSWNEVHRLGIDQITEPAGRAEFTLNGQPHTALSNTFTINREFEVTLKKAGEDAAVGFKANTDAVGDSVRTLTDAYNSLLRIGEKYSVDHGNKKLFNELSLVSRTMKDDLAGVGITSDEKGFLTVDQETLAGAVTGTDADQAFHTLNLFRNAVKRQADRASLDPMNYVNKVIVEYKNPGRTFAAPYAASAYAGMMIDRAL